MTTETVTIDKIYLAEPDLVPIIEEAKLARVRAETDDRWNYIWLEYSRLKKELSRLVGWHRPDSGDDMAWLQSMDAYNVTIRALSDALGV